MIRFNSSTISGKQSYHSISYLNSLFKQNADLKKIFDEQIMPEREKWQKIPITDQVIVNSCFI